MATGAVAIRATGAAGGAEATGAEKSKSSKSKCPNGRKIKWGRSKSIKKVL